MAANTSLLADALRLAYAAMSEERGFSQSTTAIKMRAALAAYDAAPEPMVYTLAEIRNGTGFRRGSRFAVTRP